MADKEPEFYTFEDHPLTVAEAIEVLKTMPQGDTIRISYDEEGGSLIRKISYDEFDGVVVNNDMD